MFRELVIADEIQANAKIASGVAAANKILGEISARSSDQLNVQWRLAKVFPNREGVELHLSDWAGEVTAQISCEDLFKIEQLPARLNWLYGALLQIRSHKQLERLLAPAVAGAPV